MPRDFGSEEMTSIQRRRALWAIGSAPLVAAGLARGQGSMKRVGVFTLGGAQDVTQHWKQHFPKEFEAHGFVEGRNLQLLWFEVVARMKDPKGSLADMRTAARATASEMARARLDCMVTTGEAGTALLQEVTKTTPIVTFIDDPVGRGFAKSVSRPGLNITGMHSGSDEAALKTLELLRRLIPGMTCIGWIGSEMLAKADGASETRARQAGLSLRRALVTGSEPAALATLRSELAVMRRDGCRAAILKVPIRELFDAIHAIVIENRIALVGGGIEADGFLLDFQGHRSPELRTAKRIPALVARILRGEKPGDMPFEGPDIYELSINMRTAQSLGITVPADIQLMAAHLIR
jgi:putative ABC transport system substrate-binding protein